MKSVALTVPGTGRIVDLTVQPGTTAGDVLRSAKLPQEYWLSAEGNGSFFGQEEDIYPQIQDGQKVFAMTPVEVGV